MELNWTYFSSPLKVVPSLDLVIEAKPSKIYFFGLRWEFPNETPPA